MGLLRSRSALGLPVAASAVVANAKSVGWNGVYERRDDARCKGVLLKRVCSSGAVFTYSDQRLQD